MVGDYRKNQGQMLNPQQDLTLWVLPSPAARLLCRMIIYGKPLEVRLVQQMQSHEAAIVHRSMIGACNGKPLKSTKLGILTNACLFQHQCPGVHDMRHVREHFSTEIMLEVAATCSKGSRALQDHLQEVAAIASNHSFKTSKEVYAGVFEQNSVGGLRLIDCREKLEFSRVFNNVVLGFDNVKIESHSSKVGTCVLTQMDRSDVLRQVADSIHSSKEISTQNDNAPSHTDGSHPSSAISASQQPKASSSSQHWLQKYHSDFLSQEFVAQKEPVIEIVTLPVCMYNREKVSFFKTGLNCFLHCNPLEHSKSETISNRCIEYACQCKTR